jgi:hypothetical protein
MHTSKIKIYYFVLKIPYSFLKKVQLLIMQKNNYRKLRLYQHMHITAIPVAAPMYVKCIKQQPLSTTRTL